MSRTAEIAGNNIKYHVMDPTGNITILVETPVEEASQPFIAAELMQLEPDAEQVGFLTIPAVKSAGTQPAGTQPAGITGQTAADTPERHTDDQRFCDIALRMAGGEFCGNATMSAAAFYAARNNIREGTVTVRVSGAAEPVPVEIHLDTAEPVPAEICLTAEASALSENGPVYHGTVTMPCPVAITEVKLPDYDPEETDCVYPVVHFEGIDHVILEEKTDLNRARAEELAPLWCRALQAEAVGLMFLNRSEGTLTPLVYVPEAGTLVWENSCASGTSAVGAWAASRMPAESAGSDAAGETAAVQPKNIAGGTAAAPEENPGGGNPAVQLSLQEPGGILRVEVSADGAIRLTGTVRERQ
ncbi:MAG: hypothetical protein IJ121_04110 [Eubacterium sp.]|nr:hypothetical protein [Eubacterium sp.]